MRKKENEGRYNQSRDARVAASQKTVEKMCFIQTPPWEGFKGILFLIPMSSIFKFNFLKAGAYLWKTRNAPVLPIPKENVIPLYKGTPAFVARWALVFLSLDVMYMSVIL